MKQIFLLILFFSIKLCLSQDSVNVLHPQYEISLGKIDVSKIEQTIYQLKTMSSIKVKSNIDSVDCIIKSFEFWAITEDEENPIMICNHKDGILRAAAIASIWRLKRRNKIYFTHITIIHNGEEVNLPDLRFIAVLDK
jgi:hypothetical protein